MKRLFTLLMVTAIISGTSAQLNNAPWWKDPVDGHQKTFKEIQNEFYDYWKDKDINVRGNGYKVFKRWEYHWQSRLDENGYLPDSYELVNAAAAIENNKKREGYKIAGKWKNIGPFSYTNKGSWNPGVGRINVFVEAPGGSGVLYAGGPNGGIWKSTDNGSSWEPKGDYLSYIGVSGIAVDPKDADIIYISTGDDDASDSPGVGVWKSLDGGNTWNETGGNDKVTGRGGDIFIDPTDSKKILVASGDGIYYTEDAGDKWVKSSGTNDNRFRELRFKPGNSQYVYATNGKTFFRSTDGGKSFADMQTATTSLTNLAISVTPDNPEKVYMIGAKGDFNNATVEFYVSTNSGETFSKVNSNFKGYGNYSLMGYQTWYDLALAVSETDENTMYAGLVQLWKSTDGGKNWNLVSGWSDVNRQNYSHPDVHYLMHKNGKLYVGCDGGAYISDDETQTFDNLSINGIATSQFYKLAGHPDDDKVLVGGLQDNGGYLYKDGGWNNYHGADGMDAAVSLSQSSTVYGFIQNAQAFYRSVNGGNGQDRATLPATGNWVTPLMADKDGSFLAGNDKLYRYNVNANNWSQVGSKTFADKLDEIEIAPSNAQVIYTIAKNILYKTTNGGSSWTESKLPNGVVITSVECDEKNPELIWATAKGKVYKSTDGGANWTDISDGLPDISTDIIKKKIGDDEELFVGNDLGVWYKNNNMNEWINFSNNLPHVTVTDIEINEKANLIRIATYGRGIWESDLDINIGKNDLANEGMSLTVYPNPTEGKVTVQLNGTKDASYIMEVTNMLGQQVYTSTLGKVNQAVNLEIDLSDEFNGIYFVSLKSNKGTEVRKVIKK